jgi:hypothetical protein
MKIILCFIISISLYSQEKNGFGGESFLFESRIYHGEKGKLEPSVTQRKIQISYDNQTLVPNWEWNLGVLASLGDQSRFYLRENAHALYSVGNFKMGLGRFLFSQLGGMGGTRDGAESAYLEWKTGDSSFRLYLADQYRGFPLFEKQFLRELQETKESKKNRFRHSMEGRFRFSQFEFQLFFHYVDLGNFGFQSQEMAITRAKGGDHDLLYYFDPAIVWKSKWGDLLLSYSYVRGMDRTLTNKARPEPTIPISGQRILISYGILWNSVFNGIRFFVPNGEKTNYENQILEYGYVGMGANPSQNPFSSQILNFYPSAWVTSEGFSWNRGFYQGRESAAWMEWETKIDFIAYQIGLIYNYFLPTLKTPNHKGLISFHKRDYSKEYLQEWKIGIYSKIYQASFKVEISHFQISNEERTNGQGINLSLGKTF